MGFNKAISLKDQHCSYVGRNLQAFLDSFLDNLWLKLEDVGISWADAEMERGPERALHRGKQ
jgi:hypothetical protein